MTILYLTSYYTFTFDGFRQTVDTYSEKDIK